MIVPYNFLIDLSNYDDQMRINLTHILHIMGYREYYNLLHPYAAGEDRSWGNIHGDGSFHSGRRGMFTRDYIGTIDDSLLTSGFTKELITMLTLGYNPFTITPTKE